VLGGVDGQPVLVLYPAGSAPSEPRRIVHVTDYTHCPWVIAEIGGFENECD